VSVELSFLPLKLLPRFLLAAMNILAFLYHTFLAFTDANYRLIRATLPTAPKGLPPEPRPPLRLSDLQCSRRHPPSVSPLPTNHKYASGPQSAKVRTAATLDGVLDMDRREGYGRIVHHNQSDA
jgi:hypothetical protein